MEDPRPMVAESPKKPHEYILDSLQMMPVVAGQGAVTHQAILKGWAKHLGEAGNVHVDYLKTLADDEGNIHVSKLPAPKIKHIPAMRGPRHSFNAAARWVGIDEPATPPPVVQDPRTMTAQEREAQLSIYREMGMIPGPDARRDVAVVIK